jgi:hypothetical protein
MVLIADRELHYRARIESEMQPPPFSEAPRPKSKVGIILLVIAIVCCVCCVGGVGGLGFFGMKVGQQGISFIGCGTSLTHMRDAMVAYAKDHAGKLPEKEHWQDDIQKYVKPIDQIPNFKMPVAGGDECDVQNHTSVCFNSDLAGKKLSGIEDDGTIVLWEVPTTGHNQSQPFTSVNNASGPPLVMGTKRGWIQQPVKGEAFYIDQRGIKNPAIQVSQNGNNNFQFKPGGK